MSSGQSSRAAGHSPTRSSPPQPQDPSIDESSVVNGQRGKNTTAAAPNLRAVASDASSAILEQIGGSTNGAATTTANANTIPNTTTSEQGDGDEPEHENEKTPAIPANAQMTIRIRDQAGHELAFRMRKTTTLGKAMKAFGQRLGRQMNTLRFNFDRDRVLPDQTPESLEMEEGDAIDAMDEQTGG